MTTTARNLSVLLVGAIACEFLWSWFNFSGPFRHLVDLELRWSGGYSEALTAIVLGVAAAVVAGLAVVALEHLLPRPPAFAVDALVAVVLVAVTGAMLVKSRQLWHEADSLPSVHGPLQEVDLEALGSAAPPTGHVRLMGEPARDRAITMRWHNRAATRLDVYVPMSESGPGAPSAPVHILATTGGMDETALAHPIPSNPQGVLLADALDTRTIYELRAHGMPVADHPCVLFWPGRDVDEDARIEAILLGLPALLFWPFALWDWWRRRNAPAPVVEAPAPAPLPEPAGAPRYVGYGAPEATHWRQDTSLAGLGFGASLFALGMLWEWGDLLPGSLEIQGSLAAGVLLLVSLAVDMLPARRARRAGPGSANAAAPRAAESVQQRASRHLAAVLGVAESALAPMPWPRGALVERQFEVIERELREVADPQFLRELDHGTLLRSLPMYLDAMARFHAVDPEKVDRVLGRVTSS